MKYWLCKDDVITNVLITASLEIQDKQNDKADSISCFSYTRRLLFVYQPYTAISAVNSCNRY